MRARLLDPQATLYLMPHRTSVQITPLVQGQELEITGTTMYEQQRWMIAVLPNGQRGYLQDSTTLHPTNMRLKVAVEARAEPSATAPVLDRYPWGTTLFVLGATTEGEQTWLNVRDPSGRECFIPGATPMDDDSPPTQTTIKADRGKREMVVGGAWCGGGIAVTVISYANAYGGGTYVVAWGAIIFDGYELLKGLLEGD